MDLEGVWDYSDPDGSEAKFRELLEAERSIAERMEIETQIARTFSLRREFDQAHALLDRLESEGIAEHPRAWIRYLLERGRSFNSAKQPAMALPLFLKAFEMAEATGEHFLAADAAHMVAILSSGDASLEWNLRTIAIAHQSTDPRAKKWIASAGNNLGWAYHSLGRFSEALNQFEAVAEIRREQGGENYLMARWCVARALRSLDRCDEALAVQRDLEIRRASIGKPSGFVFEEIGELLVVTGGEGSASYFKKAYDLLSQDRWIVADEPARLQRLLDLSCGE